MIRPREDYAPLPDGGVPETDLRNTDGSEPCGADDLRRTVWTVDTLPPELDEWFEKALDLVRTGEGLKVQIDPGL